MPSCWKRRLIRIKRIIRATFMVLICGLLGLTLWGPFTYEAILRWLPLDVIEELSLYTKAVSQIATVVVVHLGIIGYAFHRLPKKSQYARESVKKRKIALIAVSAVMVLLETASSFAMGGVLFQQKISIKECIRQSLAGELEPVFASRSSPAETKDPVNPETLFAFAQRQYRCCGIDSEPSGNCSITHQPVDICYEGASACSVGCLDYIMEENIYPYIHTVASVAFIVGTFSLMELGFEIRKIGKTIVQG